MLQCVIACAWACVVCENQAKRASISFPEPSYRAQSSEPVPSQSPRTRALGTRLNCGCLVAVLRSALRMHLIIWSCRSPVTSAFLFLYANVASLNHNTIYIIKTEFCINKVWTVFTHVTSSHANLL